MARERKTRFLLDENMSPLTALKLRDLGYDAVRISDIKNLGLSDYSLAEYAASSDMILVTLDKDFD